MQEILTSITISEKLALKWLNQAHVQVNRKGFSHSYRCWLPSSLAWRASYPETSGYLLENLLYYNRDIYGKTIEMAYSTACWLSEIQHPEGYYTSGIDNLIPSSFNTAQIIFGLDNAYRFFGNENFAQCRMAAKDWLISNIDSEGRWLNGLYKIGYFGTYYSRAIWPLLMISKDEHEKNLLHKSLQILWNNKIDDYGFKNLGFYSKEYPLTHTLAYALEGFLESSLILGDTKVSSQVLLILEKFAHQIDAEKNLFGRYDELFRPKSRFKCVSGQAQFVSLFSKAFIRTQNEIFKKVSIFLMEQLLQWQSNSTNKNLNGGFFASKPIYGSYFPFQMVNWTNKFFLDACYHLKLILNPNVE